MIIKARSPVVWSLSFKEWHQALALHIIRSSDTCDIEKGRGKVDVLREVFVHCIRLNHTLPLGNKGSAKGFLIHPALIEPSVLTKIEALVGRKHDDGIVIQSIILELLNQTTHIFVHTRYTGKVVAHVGLILSAYERFAFKVLIQQIAAMRPMVGFQVGTDLHVRSYAHRVRSCALTRSIIIKECIWLGETCLLERFDKPGRRSPVAVRRLKMHHQNERFLWVTLRVIPVQCTIRDDVGRVTFKPYPTLRRNKHGILIQSVSR